MDHVAYGPEHPLVPCVVPEARDTESVEAVVADVKRRTEGPLMGLMTSDDDPASGMAILDASGQEVATRPAGRPSRRMTPEEVPPPWLNYATVGKTREKCRAVEILTPVVFGTMAAVVPAPGR